jgi:hypothetical protein
MIGIGRVCMFDYVSKMSSEEGALEILCGVEVEALCL